MVVNSLIESLTEAGFSEYEARAYVAMTGSDGPMTAYEIARSSGIPTPKVYGVVSRLTAKGFISVTGEGKGRRYIPMDPDELVEGLRGRINHTLTQIEGGLLKVGRRVKHSHILNLRGRGHLMEKAERMIAGARRTLLVSLWKEEMQALRPRLLGAESKMVKLSLVHFGNPASKAGLMFNHPPGGSSLRDGERGLVVVSDSREALVGTIFKDGSAEGGMSTNRGFVAFAEDYVRHEIYLLKLMRRYDRDFRRMFGQGYEKLTDVFADESCQ